MNTDKSSTHGHRVGSTPTTNTGVHSHSLTAVDAEIAALKARVAALEAAPPPPPPGNVVKVATVPALLATLADDTVDEIVMEDGRYEIAAASLKAPTSLWISKRYAARTRPVLVRAETIGEVTFDAKQERYWGGITFNDGAHDQTWRGFRWVNGEATGTGVVTIGAYQNLAPVHRIRMEDCFIGEFWGSDTENHGHGVYVSHAMGGPHTNLVFDRVNVTDIGNHIGGGFHIYHDSYDGEVASLPGYYNVEGLIVRNSVYTGCRVGVYVWAHTGQDMLFEDIRVINARYAGYRYERGEGVTFRRCTSVGSAVAGFPPTSYIPGGPYSYPDIPEYGEDKVPGPKKITFEGCSFQ